jgi:hypothetical protein
MRVKLSLIKTVQLEVAINRYTVLEQQDGEYARILLKDGKADALAELAPELGSNLLSLSY